MSTRAELVASSVRTSNPGSLVALLLCFWGSGASALVYQVLWHRQLSLVLGSLIEGETFVVLAGFAAYRGYLSLPLVIVVATVMNFAWDQLYFWIGRRLRPESGDCCVFCSYDDNSLPAGTGAARLLRPVNRLRFGVHDAWPDAIFCPAMPRM